MPSTKKVVNESFASKPVASTKPAKQVISEGTELANRFKKLEPQDEWSDYCYSQSDY